MIRVTFDAFVTPAHCSTVATALLWTLEHGLGDDFTPETRQAWIDCYTILAGTMQESVATS